MEAFAGRIPPRIAPPAAVGNACLTMFTGSAGEHANHGEIVNGFADALSVLLGGAAPAPAPEPEPAAIG